MAEAVFKHIVSQHGLDPHFKKIESFGTAGYHTGEDPDHRSSATCRKHGVPVNHRAQQIKSKHFSEFDYIICMDKSNLSNLNRITPKGSKVKAQLFGEWNTDGKFNKIVDDPYYGGDDGFEYNFKQVTYFSEEFLKSELDVEL
jgi:low molecular weight phosphotyrosine protein phosphatase